MSYEADMRQVEAAWEGAFGEYAARRDAARRQVAHSEWASGDRYDPRPCYYLLFPGRGRLLKEPPEDYRLLPVEYGIDNQGRVVFERHHHPLYPPIEMLARHLPGRTEQVTYSAVTGTAIPGQVEHCILAADGTIERYASFHLNGFGPGPQYRGKRDPKTIRDLFGATSGLILTHDTYHYLDGRIERITNRRVGYGQPPAQTVFRIEYDERGRVERILRDGEDKGIAYQRRKRGESLQRLLNAAQAALRGTIPETLRRAAFDEPLYCLVLNYRSVTQYYPPYLLPGFASEREELLNQGEWWQIWSPLPTPGQPWPIYPITDPATLEACDRAEHAINTAQAWDLAGRSLRALARDLNRLDWSAIMPVTSDFVVYAFNYEDDILPALQASAPAAQLRAWRKRGMLG